MQNNTLSRIDELLDEIKSLDIIQKDLGATLTAQTTKLDSKLTEQILTSKSLQALQDVRPILAAVSSEQSVSLANQALYHVFGTEDKLFFSEEESRFFISTPEGDTDLVAANGGGYLAVISFIFTLFLLIRGKHRRVLFYDEQFTMISDEALSRFIPFLKTLCKDLSIDCLFITHDSRIEFRDVDNVYWLENGIIKKLNIT